MIKEVDGPGVAYEEIADSKLRLNIRKAGCCGLDELLKLRALQLEEYDRVLVLDGDTIMLGPVDRLFATNLLSQRATLGLEPGMQIIQRLR